MARWPLCTPSQSSARLRCSLLIIAPLLPQARLSLGHWPGGRARRRVFFFLLVVSDFEDAARDRRLPLARAAGSESELLSLGAWPESGSGSASSPEGAKSRPGPAGLACHSPRLRPRDSGSGALGEPKCAAKTPRGMPRCQWPARMRWSLPLQSTAALDQPESQWQQLEGPASGLASGLTCQWRLRELGGAESKSALASKPGSLLNQSN